MDIFSFSRDSQIRESALKYDNKISQASDTTKGKQNNTWIIHLFKKSKKQQSFSSLFFFYPDLVLVNQKVNKKKKQMCTKISFY